MHNKTCKIINPKHQIVPFRACGDVGQKSVCLENSRMVQAHQHVVDAKYLNRGNQKLM